MVKIDFTSYRTLSACPIWWRGFVNLTPVDDVDQILEAAGCLVIDNPAIDSDVICLVFISQEAYDSFRTYWTLRGEITE